MHQAFPAGSLRSRGHLPPGAGAEHGVIWSHETVHTNMTLRPEVIF